MIDPHSFADPSQGRTTDVTLRLRVDFQDRVLSGSAELLLAEAAAGPLDLDTRDLHIASVECEDAAGGWEDCAWAVAEAADFRGARLCIQRPVPTRRLRIHYRTDPASSALAWLTPAQTFSGTQPFVFSQCQAIHARSVAPLQDTPGIRIRYQAVLDVPEALLPIMSSAPGVAEDGAPEGEQRYRFDMPQPIPPYLLAFAVGELEARDLGPRCRIYAEPAVIEQASWEFAEIEQMLTAAEGLFGPYRWERFDFAVMPPSFPYGGMENPRLTFLTPTLLAGDRSLTGVLAHELAHSWTGNLVTNVNMNHFWLNEGWTVWAERRILESLYGSDVVALSAGIGRNALEGQIARFGADSPLTRLRTDLAGQDPDEVYSIVPYEKGCLLLTLVEQHIGRARFDAFAQAYIERFSFQSIDTDDFLLFFDEQLPGLRAELALDRWIEEPGLPESAPSAESAVLDELNALATGWSEGARPDVAQARAWHPRRWQILLPRLPRPLSGPDISWLHREFGLVKSDNAEVLAAWLELALLSGFSPALPRAKEFLARVGRMKYLKPLYRALISREEWRATARAWLTEFAPAYHPVAAAGLGRILDEAGV